ncbi:MAG TPA: tyrosine--tRNA ligase [Acidimicrobiia bacterium]|nr:tyrosine--tRNA ligase [Acidimicrobiia bacterium]
MTDVKTQLDIICSGTQDLVSTQELEKMLARGKPLRVKFGIDPTSPDIHIGHAVPLRKLKQFQDLGHTAILLFGDFTARVGDPSGRNVTRPQLSVEEIEENLQTYLEQAFLILDKDKTEIRRNSEWLEGLGIVEIMKLMGSTTVAQLLERNDFSNRYKEGSPISVLEFLYPLLVGFDSVALKADVELGGTDQLYNLLMGRPLQEMEGQIPQVCITTPLLEGTDGNKKMSKSLNNTIGLTDQPLDMYGKVMSISDEMMPKYFQLSTGWLPEEVSQVVCDLKSGKLAQVDAKKLLAKTVVDLYHGDGRGDDTAEEWVKIFSSGGRPSEIEMVEVSKSEFENDSQRLARILNSAGLVASNKEGARMISQGAVRIEDVAFEDPDGLVSITQVDGKVIQVGKRKWAQISVTNI